MAIAKNSLLAGMQADANYTLTENGAVTHFTTHSDLLDMFALGGAYRNRNDADVITLFLNAFNENPVYALKCLFYLRDVRGGQGERRFFRVAINWLAKNHTDAVRRNLEHIPEFGRWDDLYSLVGTPLENEMFAFIRRQLNLDIESKTPSLLAKWLKSENTSSAESRRLGAKTRNALHLTSKQYRKVLSALRARINVLERLMSENRWDEIEFDKIPSQAGMKYKNAFARHDIERMKSGKETYKAFAADTSKTVNAEALTPVEIAHQIYQYNRWRTPSDTTRQMWQKYWDNLKDYYNGRQETGLAMVDVSGSMYGVPIEAAVSMGAYIAERGKGPFQNHFLTFSGRPELVRFTGEDIFDKFQRAKDADWGMNTNIESAFHLILNTAIKNKVPASDMPSVLYIFSDMEFDRGLLPNITHRSYWAELSGEEERRASSQMQTLLEKIAQKWEAFGYELPRVVFWNLDARQNNIPALGGRFSYVSGFSMNMVEQILSGKDGYDLMMAKLNSPRYAVIQ